MKVFSLSGPADADLVVLYGDISPIQPHSFEKQVLHPKNTCGNNPKTVTSLKNVLQRLDKIKFRAVVEQD